MKAIMTSAQYLAYVRRRRGSAKKLPALHAWSAPERRYHSTVLHGRGLYEAEHIRFTPEHAERHCYTPDFMTQVSVDGATRVVYHEVKGSYRLGSQDAARLRFIMSSVVRPYAYFVWAKERRNRLWEIDVVRGGHVIAAARDVIGFEINEEGEVTWQHAKPRAKAGQRRAKSGRR